MPDRLYRRPHRARDADAVRTIGECTKCNNVRELHSAMDGQLCQSCMDSWMTFFMDARRNRGEHV